MNNEDKDKCFNCPYNDTSCPGGSWCDKAEEMRKNKNKYIYL